MLFFDIHRYEATEMALKLIRQVFPRLVDLPPPSFPNLLRYPDFDNTSKRIMQLPLRHFLMRAKNGMHTKRPW